MVRPALVTCRVYSMCWLISVKSMYWRVLWLIWSWATLAPVTALPHTGWGYMYMYIHIPLKIFNPPSQFSRLGTQVRFHLLIRLRHLYFVQEI